MDDLLRLDLTTVWMVVLFPNIGNIHGSVVFLGEGFFLGGEEEREERDQLLWYL